MHFQAWAGERFVFERAIREFTPAHRRSPPRSIHSGGLQWSHTARARTLPTANPATVDGARGGCPLRHTVSAPRSSRGRRCDKLSFVVSSIAITGSFAAKPACHVREDLTCILFLQCNRRRIEECILPLGKVLGNPLRARHPPPECPTHMEIHIHVDAVGLQRRNEMVEPVQIHRIEHGSSAHCRRASGRGPSIIEMVQACKIVPHLAHARP